MLNPQNIINQLFGPPVSVDDETIQACRDRNAFGGLSFDLYREAVVLIWVTCSAHYDNGNGFALTRNQAVCAGLLSRMSKLMGSVLKLSSEVEHGEAVQILNRCILESSVDLQYLLVKDDANVYEKFVTTGLKGEKELYDIIQFNIQERGGQELEIEQGMIQSIIRTCDESGVKIEDIDLKAGSWGGSYRDRMKAIGLEEGYPILQGMTSQSVHGSWSDLIRNYLDKNDAGYEPKADHTQTDGEMFGPVAIFATNAARAYVERFFEALDASPFLDRLNDLQYRIGIVEQSRPGWDIAG